MEQVLINFPAPAPFCIRTAALPRRAPPAATIPGAISEVSSGSSRTTKKMQCLLKFELAPLSGPAVS